MYTYVGLYTSKSSIIILCGQAVRLYTASTGQSKSTQTLKMIRSKCATVSAMWNVHDLQSSDKQVIQVDNRHTKDCEAKKACKGSIRHLRPLKQPISDITLCRSFKQGAILEFQHTSSTSINYLHHCSVRRSLFKNKCYSISMENPTFKWKHKTHLTLALMLMLVTIFLQWLFGLPQRSHSKAAA